MTEGQGSLEASLGDWLASRGSTDAALDLLTTAEGLLGTQDPSVSPHELWHQYLNETRRPVFLQALPDAAARVRWAETSFSVILAAQFGLESLFEQRVQEHPDRTFFKHVWHGGNYV